MGARTDSAYAALLVATAPCESKARATYPNARARFAAGLPAGHSFFVVTRLHDSRGKVEQVFVFVDSITTGTLRGRNWNEIRVVLGFRRGQAHVFPEREIVDWLITRPDGSEEGNHVGKFIDEWQRRGAPPSEMCA